VRTLLGQLGQQVEDDLLQVLGHFGTLGTRRAGRGVAVADEDRPGVAEVERRCPGGEFVQHAAEGVEVAALVDLGAADLFRRHVVRGAHRDAGAGEPGGEADVGAEAGDAEVADLHRAVGQPHDVRGLQVPVHDALLVAVGEGGGDLLGDVDDVTDGQWPLLVVLQELAEVAAVEEFHHQVEDTVGLAEVVDDRHTPVLQGRRHPGLAPEPLAQHAGERLVVVRTQRLEALHGDMPPERLVPRAPHLAHAAAPDQFEQPVAALDQPAVPHLPRSPPSVFVPPSPGSSSMASDRPTLYGPGRVPSHCPENMPGREAQPRGGGTPGVPLRQGRRQVCSS
jgi:hypothetical protein